jgi:ATP-dependent Lon protease
MGEKRSAIQNISMPLIALRGLVLFPKMVLHFDIGRERSIQALNDAVENNSRRVFLTAQKDISDDNPSPSGLYHVGVVAEVKQVIRIPNMGLRVMVEGLYRAKCLSFTQEDPHFIVETRAFPVRRLAQSSLEFARALVRTVKNLFEEYANLSPKMPKELMLGVMTTEDPVLLGEFIAGNIPISVEEKQEILEESNVLHRLQILAETIEHENGILALERDIYEKVREGVDKNQREYFLREQMKVISEELGEEDSPESEVVEYIKKIEEQKLDPEAEEKLKKEANRLLKMPSNSHEAGVIRGYLDICLDLPWNKQTAVRSDVKTAERILERDHYGMKKVKQRVVESIAVRALAPDMKGQILCLVGPPGVGKTSIARSIAEASGRKYVRLSLGGMRDESDIRGHRKTYIGSMPGRIIDAMRRAGSKNPLMLLDEVDKLGADYKGDPSSALLEVLDAEQNHAFRDHFIELPFDLSQVLFVATANNPDMIPGPLYDRMEIIELPSYTRVEKFNIAKNHLIPRQRSRHGLNGRQVRFKDDAIYFIIDYYTRESGVRKLEQTLAAVLRKCARNIVAEESKQITVTPERVLEMLGPKKYFADELLANDEVGVANGLAWTSVGGDMLQVEVAVFDGSGKLELTGHLGDVMKESAHAAISFLRSRSEFYGIDKEFYKNRDIHVHVPEGAVPKDGPSAGVTICTAMLSALTCNPVRRDVAMTGEISLRGRVLPIGGLREKTMAAYRAGVKTVIIPADNEPELEEIDEVVRSKINFVTAVHIDTVLAAALLRNPERKDDADPVIKTAPNDTAGVIDIGKPAPLTCRGR